ncbi:MAG: hypothetical protein LBD61_04200, partial [Endomicrobium sp.]|nr:hypothetical protein [Endomicrobium sp.]
MPDMGDVMGCILNFLKKLKTQTSKMAKLSMIIIFIKIKEFSLNQWISLFIVNTILLSFVYGDAIGQVLVNIREGDKFRQIFSEFTLPYSYGTITMANFSASDKVIINIQDLHMHSEAQKNIKNIIEEFDKTYKIKKIYLEGAYGDLDTSWIADIKDKSNKTEILNKIMDTGMLTGAEYYSAENGKKYIIKGLENKEAYLDNLKRFGEILNNEGEINEILDSIHKDIQDLKAMYYNSKQKNMEYMYSEYIAGRMNAEKYYGLMEKYTDSIGIDLHKYKNIDIYLRMLREKKKIDFDRATKELQVLVMRLKESLPYNAYKMMEEKTKEFKEIDKLYAYLVKLSRENNIDLSINFPELWKFFSYIELGKELNPLEMITEEERLRGQINFNFSNDQGIRDIVFMVVFERYMRDYLSSKITSDDYEYYKINIERFKDMWVKYVDNVKMNMLKKYEDEADKFYVINLQRNKYFLKNMDLIENTGKIEKNYDENLSDEAKVIESLKDAVEIGVVITGGFHTRGLSDLLAKEGISYLVITPNVSGSIKEAENTYYNIAKEQGRVLSSALAVLPQSMLAQDNKELFSQQLSEALLKSNATIEEINTIFSRIVLPNNEVKLTSLDINESDNIELEVKEGGQAIKKYKYDSETKAFKEVGASVPGAKSVKSTMGVVTRTSIGLSVTLGVLSVLIAVLATLLAGTLWFLFPLIPLCLVVLASIYVVPTLIYEWIQSRFLGREIVTETGSNIRQELVFADLTETGATTIFDEDGKEKNVSKARMLRKIIITLPTDLGIDFLMKALGIDRQKAIHLLGYTGIETEDDKRDVKLTDLIEQVNSEALDAGEMMKCVSSQEKTLIKINFELLRNRFFDASGKTIINRELLETVVEHELEHYRYATSTEGIRARIHRSPWLEEVLVSLRDGFIRLRIWQRGLFSVKVRTGQTGMDDEMLIEQFRIMQAKQYGEAAYYSEKTNSQIKAALEVAQMGAVATLGTGGGKSDMGKLAMAIILAREWRGERKAGILYSSARDNLTTRDLAGLAKFLNSPEIVSVFKGIVGYRNQNSSGLFTEVTINGNKRSIIVVGHILPSTEKVTIYDENGNPIEGQVMVEVNGTLQEINKTWLYANAPIVGGDKSTLVWDFENVMTEKKVGQKAMMRIGVFDEAHTLLDELNQSFVQGSSVERKKGQLDLQKIARDYVKDLKAGSDYKVKNGAAELTQEGRRKVEKYFKDNDNNIDPEFTSDEWIQIVTWALTAREYKDGKEYTTGNRTGKIFKSKDSKVQIELEVKRDRAGENFEVKGTITILGKMSPILLNTTFDNINTIDALWDVLKKDYQELVDNAQENVDWSSVSIQNRTYIDIINSQTSEVSESSKWTGLHAAIELYLESLNKPDEPKKYNFADNYSIDTTVRRRYAIVPWMEKLVAVTGYTGTMPEGFFNRTLSRVFKRGIKSIESGAVAKPTIARPKLFSKNNDRITAVIRDTFLARATFALTNDETGYKNGMVVFGSIGELRRAETDIKGAAKQLGMPKEKIIIIDGEKDSAEDIENKIKLLKENTDYLVLATNIVSIGVDAPFGFVFNAMAERQNEDERKQLRDRAGRSGGKGIVREYYSIEDIEENDETRDLIRQLRKPSSKEKKVNKKDAILDNGNLNREIEDPLIGIFDAIAEEYAEGEFLSDSGIRIIKGLTSIIRERGIDAAVRNMERNARETEILDQFVSELQSWREDGDWISKYFKVFKGTIEYNALVEIFGGESELKIFRESVFKEIENNMELFLTAQEDIDAQEDTRFADARTSALLGMLEVTAAGEKAIAREKLFYGAAMRVAKNKITEQLNNAKEEGAQLEGTQVTKNEQIEKYIITVNKTGKRSFIVRFLHWISSSLMSLISKIITIAIPVILGGGLVGIVITSIMSSLSVGIPVALQFFANIVLFLSGGAFSALPIAWIIVIAVALVLLVIVLNAFVKRITAVTEETDNENIAKYRDTGRGGMAAAKGTVNKTLATLSKIALTIGAISLISGFLIPGVGIAMIAAGIFMLAAGALAALILMAINWKVLRDKKVAPSTTTKKIGRNVGFGLLIGAALVVPVLAIGIGWGIVVGLVIAVVVLLAKYIYDRIVADAVDLKTSFLAKENIIPLLLATIAGAGLLLGLFFGASAILGLIFTVASAAITICFAVLTLIGTGRYMWNKVRGKDRLSIEKYGAADTSKSNKAGTIFKGLLTIIVPLAFCALMLYVVGIASLGLWPILIAVGIGLVLAVIIWFFVGTENSKQITMMAVAGAGTAISVISNLNRATTAIIAQSESAAGAQSISQQTPEILPASVDSTSAIVGLSNPLLAPAVLPRQFVGAGLIRPPTQAQEATETMTIGQLKDSNPYTKVAGEFIDSQGRYYWLINFDGQTYRIYPYHEDGTMLTADELETAVKAAPMIKWLHDNYPNLSETDINNILFDNRSGHLKNGIEWDFTNHKIVNGEQLVKNYQDMQTQINSVLKLLETYGYTVIGVEYEGAERVPVFKVSRDGLTINIYPLDVNTEGAYTFGIDKVNQIFIVYGILSTTGYTIQYISEEGKAAYFRVTDADITINIYPFDINNNAVPEESIQQILATYETLKEIATAGGYTLSYVEGTGEVAGHFVV